ncbi:uncharacterized protein LOC127834803 isoform X1 [Dreissena polymorpha]|uniref:uncharacterized protein LOC127834803 isoform X1 n=1 Tax=Dreissena polymorpha TaxID=45954 RepID=UPI00226472D8|nr:uncharacterized protein LOC127834803 isoform X1 [Dreissena polymorpha]
MDMNGCCHCVALCLCLAWSVSGGDVVLAVRTDSARTPAANLLHDGFHCYQCSFDRYNKAEWNKEECITNPETIRPTFPCNETSYCITQAKFDTESGTVIYFYRSCSLTPMDYCDTNGPELLTAISCQGELCNNHTELYRICSVTTDNISSTGYEILPSLGRTMYETTTPIWECNIASSIKMTYILSHSENLLMSLCIVMISDLYI